MIFKNIILSKIMKKLYIFNEFSIQIIRALWLLKDLSDIDITDYLFESQSRITKLIEEKMQLENIDECLTYLRKDKIDLNSFNSFFKNNKDIYNDYKLILLNNKKFN